MLANVTQVQRKSCHKPSCCFKGVCSCITTNYILFCVSELTHTTETTAWTIRAARVPCWFKLSSQVFGITASNFSWGCLAKGMAMLLPCQAVLGADPLVWLKARWWFFFHFLTVCLKTATGICEYFCMHIDPKLDCVCVLFSFSCDAL